MRYNDDAEPGPHDLDAEAAVISAVLVDESALAKVNDLLRPEHFYAEAHRRIFEATLDRGAAAQTPGTSGAWLVTPRNRRLRPAAYRTSSARPVRSHLADQTRIGRQPPHTRLESGAWVRSRPRPGFRPGCTFLQSRSRQAD